MDIKTIQVIINPAAGLEEPVLKTLNTIFRENGVRWDASITNEAGDGQRLAKAAIAQGVDLIAAYGGDGTLAEVAAGMVGSDVPLAFLPGGTGNVMAAEFGISRYLERAAAQIFLPNTRPQPVDLGVIGEGVFMLRASVGFEAAVVKRTSRDMKDRFGLLAYGLALLETLSQPLHAHYHLTLDGEEVEAYGFSLLIANAGSIGRMNLSLASSIRADDGLLDVMILNTDPETMAAMAASVIQLDQLDQQYTAALQHWRVKEVTVVTDPPQHVQVDGDLFDQETPVTARVIPGAVRVMVPA